MTVSSSKRVREHAHTEVGSGKSTSLPLGQVFLFFRGSGDAAVALVKRVPPAFDELIQLVKANLA